MEKLTCKRCQARVKLYLDRWQGNVKEVFKAREDILKPKHDWRTFIPATTFVKRHFVYSNTRITAPLKTRFAESKVYKSYIRLWLLNIP